MGEVWGCSSRLLRSLARIQHRDLRLYASALELEFVDWYDDEEKRDSILENRPAFARTLSALNDPSRLFKAVVNAAIVLRTYRCDTE